MQPFVNGNDARANSLAFWRTYDQFIADKDPIAGVKVLGVMTAPGADFFSLTGTPIASLEDVRNRKMWALPGVTADIVKETGSAAVSGPAVQMTEIIQRGVVDGFVGIPDADAQAYNLIPYVKSVTQTNAKIFAPNFMFFMSEAKWAEIDPADQEAIMTVSGEAFAELAGKAWAAAETAAEEELAGSTQVAPAPETFEAELHKIAEPHQAQWVEAAAAKGIDGQAALDFYRKTVSELSAN